MQLKEKSWLQYRKDRCGQKWGEQIDERKQELKRPVKILVDIHAGNDEVLIKGALKRHGRNRNRADDDVNLGRTGEPDAAAFAKIDGCLAGAEKYLLHRAKEPEIQFQKCSEKVSQPVLERNHFRRSGLLAALVAKRAIQVGIAVEAAVQLVVLISHDLYACDAGRST